MALKVKQIGAVELDHTLHIKEEFEPDDVLAEAKMSSAGTHIVFLAPIYTPYITLESLKHGWISEETKNSLLAQYAQLGATFVITYSDDNTENVRYAHEKGISFVPLTEGSSFYSVYINLAKVI